MGKGVTELGVVVKMSVEEVTAVVGRRTSSPEQMVSLLGVVWVQEAPAAAVEVEVASGSVVVEAGAHPQWKVLLHPHRHYPAVLSS